MDPEPGWKAKRLLRLGFVPGNDETVFGFLDPAQVIRAVHFWPLSGVMLPSISLGAHLLLVASRILMTTGNSTM